MGLNSDVVPFNRSPHQKQIEPKSSDRRLIALVLFLFAKFNYAVGGVGGFEELRNQGQIQPRQSSVQCDPLTPSYGE